MGKKRKQSEGKIIDLKEWQEMQKYQDKVEPDGIKVEKLYELLHFTNTIKRIMEGELQLEGHVIDIHSKECKQISAIINNFFNKVIYFDEGNIVDLKNILMEARDILKNSKKY